jgi:hypothetical protein
VRNREGRHSSYKAARAFHQNHQREDKEQVVNSAQNVFDPKAQIRESDFPPPLRSRCFNPWL